MICERAGTAVEAFRIPMWGQAADEVPPDWLIARWQRSEILLNHLGGFSKPFTDGAIGSMPGDYLVLEGDEIEFCTASEFTQSYHLLDERHAA